jgi:UDP-glucose 4-epimerase
MKKYIVVTGGAGFVGSSLIERLKSKTKKQILSIDNYSSGTKKNHIKNKKIKYINSHTKNIAKILRSKKNQIECVFHFGEFARIFQSFNNMNDCIESNSIGSLEVFNFCLDNKIKLIYSATSASLGNKGNDKNLSPYAFTKANNLEFLENLKKWFKFKFEIIYFYNVYGSKQISKGNMATVIGIFQEHFKKNLSMPVVLPGNQSRRFTHIDDTIEVCIEAWKKNKCKHYSISNKKSYTIREVAKQFSDKIKYLPPRAGERYASALTDMNLSNKVLRRFGKKSLYSYIKQFKKTVKNINKN